MKTVTIAATKLLLVILSFVSPVFLLAQEGAKVDVNINKDGGSAWYNNPVVWVIGAAVFILLLVALLRGNNSPKS